LISKNRRLELVSPASLIVNDDRDAANAPTRVAGGDDSGKLAGRRTLSE
jgi:hypothetical protein